MPLLDVSACHKEYPRGIFTIFKVVQQALRHLDCCLPSRGHGMLDACKACFRNDSPVHARLDHQLCSPSRCVWPLPPGLPSAMPCSCWCQTLVGVNGRLASCLKLLNQACQPFWISDCNSCLMHYSSNIQTAVACIQKTKVFHESLGRTII